MFSIIYFTNWKFCFVKYLRELSRTTFSSPSFRQDMRPWKYWIAEARIMFNRRMSKLKRLYKLTRKSPSLSRIKERKINFIALIYSITVGIRNKLKKLEFPLYYWNFIWEVNFVIIPLFVFNSLVELRYVPAITFYSRLSVSWFFEGLPRKRSSRLQIPTLATLMWSPCHLNFFLNHQHQFFNTYRQQITENFSDFYTIIVFCIKNEWILGFLEFWR